MSLPAHRRTDAAFAALLWILGGELLPLAHVVMHDDLAEHSHTHADGERHADHDHDPAPSPTSSEDADTRPTDEGPHGEGSFAHHDAMIAFGGLAMPLVPPSRLGVAAPVRTPWAPGEHAPERCHQARGPPILA